MFKDNFKKKSAESDALSYLSGGFSDLQQLPPLQVSDIWQNYRLGGLTERALLQALSKRVAEFKVPHHDLPSKFDVATMLSQAPCANKMEAADAIDALLYWADHHAITIVDQASQERGQ